MSEDPFQDLSPIEPEAQYKCELQPATIDAGKNAQLIVTNEGQTSESFTINWDSQDDLLVFELWQPEGEEYVFKEAREHDLEVEPGAEQTVHFRAGLLKRPFFGGRAAYPFQIQVSSSTDDVQFHEGHVNQRGIIPIWLLPVLLVLCLCLICSGILLFNWWGGGDDTAATQTAVAATVMANIVEGTLVAEGTHSAQLTAGAPTNTPEPTATFTSTSTPTDTPEPTATPLPTETGLPTGTATPTFTTTPTEVPTGTPTEVPTEVPTEAATDTPEPTEHPGADLLDITWVLEGYLADMGDDKLTEPLPGVDVDMIFEEDFDFGGRAGCNTYSGRYVTDGKQIAFQNIAATKLLCTEPEGIMEQEALYLSLLERAEEYRINQDEQLEIIRTVIENEEEVEKVILLFYDLSIGP